MPDLTAHPEYAYSPRQGARANGHYHAVLDQPLVVGRFRREKGHTLCGRRFWGLAPTDASPVTCPRCRDQARRDGVTLTDPTEGRQ